MKHHPPRHRPMLKAAALSSLCLTALCAVPASAWAWGPDGHHTVGAIADRLLIGTPAATHVHDLLGGLSLQDAAVWADCAKGIDPAQGYAYTAAGMYPECKIYENPTSEAEMADYVRRNDTNCDPKPGEESCHKQYHYSDVAIQRGHYDPRAIGARPDDVVAAVTAAVLALQGRPAPAPFDIKDPREALLLLAHFVGDLHQPLHVGAIYLDAQGRRIDPDAAGSFDPATDTRGGNDIAVRATGPYAANLHATWDAVPDALKVDAITTRMLDDARAVQTPAGAPAGWSTVWADGTMRAAQRAFEQLTFTAVSPGHWSVMLPSDYPRRMLTIKQPQIVEAGGRLAQVLKAIWP